jgi:DNA-binding transcriptional ArsR family regulator
MGTERQDGIDRFVAGVVAIFPTLDPEVEAAVDRMSKIMKYIDRATEGNVKVFGLNVGEFKVLLRLREANDETLTAGALADMLDLSPSAMTNRLDRLEEDGLVESSLLAVLSATDQRRLNVLLRALSLEIEDRGFVPPSHHAAHSEA